MSEFNFNKSITIYPAFDAFVKKHFSTCLGIGGGSTNVNVVFSSILTNEEQVSLSNLVSNYVNPSYWLDLDHTESAPLTTEFINSSTPSVLQSIIVSPYGQPNIVLDNFKSIIRYTTNNTSYFSNWDSNIDPINFTLILHNYNNNSEIKSVTANINADIYNWKTMVQAGSNTLPDIYKTIQIYGLKDVVPGYDTIWLFKGSISNSNVNASLNGLQKLYYQVTLPQ